MLRKFVMLVAMADPSPFLLLALSETKATWTEAEERGIASMKSVHKMGDNS